MSDAERDDLIAEIRERSGPIEDHLEALKDPVALPALALGLCTMRIDEAGPPLRALLDKAADGALLDRAEANLLFCGIHILGGARDRLAGAPLLRLLRRPADEIEPLLGDVMTDSLPRIVAGTFDGDTQALLATIADREVDEFVRDSLLGAAAFLAWEGRIDREAVRAFLERFFRVRLAEPGEFAWHGWQEAIALLGLRDLAPLVREAFAQDLLPERALELEEFEADLAEAERAPGDPERFRKARLGYIEDVAGELEWVDWSGERDDDLYGGYDDNYTGAEAGWAEPAVNPLRHIGRNDPCPCGSGKKFKKCCI